jgi:hypothetical protein
MFIFKKYLALSLLLIVAIFFLAGCASAPLYSHTNIPNKRLNAKYKIDIKKEDIAFSGNLTNGTGESVDIYNCIGKEIYDKILYADVFMVNKRPDNPNIIYIHDFSNAVGWTGFNPVNLAVIPLIMIPPIYPFIPLMFRVPNHVSFTADVSINGKNYPINAKGIAFEFVNSPQDSKWPFNKACGNFEKKFISFLLAEKKDSRLL